MNTKTEDRNDHKIEKMQIGKNRVSNWATFISALLSLLGGIVSSLSIVGFKELSSQQLIIFGAIFTGIILTAVVLRQIQKMGHKIRMFRRKFEEAYISQLDASLINPERK